MDVIRQLANEFLERERDYIEADAFIPKARKAAKEIDAKADRVQFLTLIMQGLTKWYEDHLPCNETNCWMDPPYKKASYFLSQELARLDVRVDTNTFTSVERDALLAKLDKVLEELEQIKAGQGVVAEEVEELKDLMYLGKQKWHRQYVGTVSDWVASGVITEATAKPLLEAIRNALNELPTLLGL